MAKNTVSTPIKDGVKADNSTYSSNKIEALLGAVADLIIDDDAVSETSTWSSTKISTLFVAPEDEEE